MQVDSDAVASTWKFSSAGDRDQFAAKIRRMPSVGIRTYGGELASFTVLDASGFFNNQFTFPEHRQRGLADRSELRLCQKVIRSNFLFFMQTLANFAENLFISLQFIHAFFGIGPLLEIHR